MTNPDDQAATTTGPELTPQEAFEGIVHWLRSPNLCEDHAHYPRVIEEIAAKTNHDPRPRRGIMRGTTWYEFLCPDGTWSGEEGDALRLSPEEAEALAPKHPDGHVMELEPLPI
jgi:hypothetical protein